jgi:hypothetical protein
MNSTEAKGKSRNRIEGINKSHSHTEVIGMSNTEGIGMSTTETGDLVTDHLSNKWLNDAPLLLPRDESAAMRAVIRGLQYSSSYADTMMLSRLLLRLFEELDRDRTQQSNW